MRATKWTVSLTITLMALSLRPAHAQEEGPTPADMQTGSLIMRMATGYVTATALNTDVNIVVNGCLLYTSPSPRD